MSYQPVKQEDTHLPSDDDSSTIYSDAALSNDHHEQQQRRPWASLLRPRALQSFSTLLQILLFIETLIIIFLAATNLTTLRATLRQQKILNAQHSTADAGYLPTTFGRDRRYMTLDPKYDHLWADWTADAQVAVPGELPGEEDVQGGYSMFHQMHCLASMRRAIQVARSGEEDPGIDYLDNGHWPHCFDYLRKSILCWADDTIEVARVIEGKRLPYIDGSSTMRQCKSPEMMFYQIRLDEKRVEKLNKEDGLEHENKGKHGKHIVEIGSEPEEGESGGGMR